MQNEYGPDLLTLVDNDGNEHEFELLDVIDNDEGSFYALLPTFSDPKDEVESQGTYYIFQSFEKDGEQELAEIEDDDLLSRLAEEFEKRFEESYGEDEDETENLEQ